MCYMGFGNYGKEVVMREIKFRVWVKNKEYMKTTKAAVNTIISYFILDSSEKEDYVLMQYTGLKDKNGKEIYEGDIVKTKFGNGKVFMRLGCWFIENQKELGYYSNYELEVIGNIYENPELLEVKNDSNRN